MKTLARMLSGCRASRRGTQDYAQQGIHILGKNVWKNHKWMALAFNKQDLATLRV